MTKDFTHDQKENQTKRRALPDHRKISDIAVDDIVHPILDLQSTIGNRAVQRLITVDSKNVARGTGTDHNSHHDSNARQASPNARSGLQLKKLVETSDDIYEQEADRNVQQINKICEVASKGIAGPSEPLPYLDTIQRSFGSHDVSGIEAHLDTRANEANQELGSVGYAKGNHVAFAHSPDIHTAAHEAAHVVQQTAGIQPKDGVSELGDIYEQHADAVADFVVQGKQAWPLLDQNLAGAEGNDASAVGTGFVGNFGEAVQMQPVPKGEEPPLEVTVAKKFFQNWSQEWKKLDRVKKPIVTNIVVEYLKDNPPIRLEVEKYSKFEDYIPPKNVFPAITSPDFNDIYRAIYAAIDLNQTGIGTNPTVWKWKDVSLLEPKTQEDILEEKEKLLIKEGAIEYTLAFVVEPFVEGLGIAAGVVSPVGLVVGAVILIIELSELSDSIKEPKKREMTPDELITAEVKAWLREEQIQSGVFPGPISTGNVGIGVSPR